MQIIDTVLLRYERNIANICSMSVAIVLLYAAVLLLVFLMLRASERGGRQNMLNGEMYGRI